MQLILVANLAQGVAYMHLYILYTIKYEWKHNLSQLALFKKWLRDLDYMGTNG